MVLCLPQGLGMKPYDYRDPQTGAQIGNPLTGHTGCVTSVCFNHDGTLLASGSWDKTIRLWDPKTGAQIGEPLMGNTHWVESVCFNHNGTLLASASDRTIKFWDPKTHSNLFEFSPIMGFFAPYSLCFSPDGKLFATAGIQGNKENVLVYQAGGDPITVHKWIANNNNIKPEHIALLQQAKNPRKLDWLRTYSGKSKISLPVALQEKMPITYLEQIQKNWNNLSPEQKDLAVSTSLLGAISAALMNGY